MVNVEGQVEAARRTALAVPRADVATLVVTGGDRVSWLNGLLTCDLLRRAHGDAVYGLAVARSGRVLSDVTVAFDDVTAALLVAVPAAAFAALREHLEHYLVMEDAEVAPTGDAYTVWDIHGPAAGRIAEAVRAAGLAGGRVDRTGLGGAVLLARAGAAEARAAVERAVADEGAVVGDDAGWEALRLERAVPRFGVDFDERTYPQEASLEKTAVRFDKGCYLGQEVVCMLEMRGHVKRRLVPVVFDAAQPPARGAPVEDDAGAPVGEVTSAARSPTLGKAVALAMLKRACAEPGRRVAAGGARGEVVQLPA